MNGPKYVDLLKEKLNLYMHVHGYTTVMQDGAPYQRWKMVTECLKKNKICVMEWLEYSQYLKPFENLWTVMKVKVAYKQLISSENLKQAVEEVWVTEIAQKYCESLVASKANRIQVVIDNKAGHTKYWKSATFEASRLK